MHIPKPTFDWTINVTNLLTIVFLLASMATGWYNLKSDVIINKAQADQKFSDIDKAFTAQSVINKDQSDRIVQESRDTQQILRDSTSDIKQDIRDLQSEIVNSRANQHH